MTLHDDLVLKLRTAGHALSRAKIAERKAMALLDVTIREAADHLSEYEIARVAGVNRNTVRRALGKPRSNNAVRSRRESKSPE